ncbi:hypothetical protein SAY87_016994 [Trapa incisa]|uniref:Malectin-like domain-containing protein n=1 Tax=Trapa incisa TaxID=236973 RepID=A0AAN7QZK7_9MYRT|nr:hypothetical protein SAY87_016994 [Trapa incisa]
MPSSFSSSFLLLCISLPLLLLLLLPSCSSNHLPYGSVSFHIDCGGPTPSTDRFGTEWVADRYFTGGAAGIVSEPLRFSLPQEKTLRYFPLSSGKKNCYIIPGLPDGRYYFRTFTVYDNYDGRSHPPSFEAAVEGTTVFGWRTPWPSGVAQTGAYSDLLAFVRDGEADVCFYSIATDPPVIGSLSILQIDPESYNSDSINGTDFILVNYGRLDCGSGQWGPGFSNDTDLFGRSWQSDYNSRTPSTRKIIDAISTSASIKGTDQAPNYFPMKLYQTAVTLGQSGVIEYELEVDAKLDYMLWLHFAEIDSRVNKIGQRVFDVVVNGENVTQIDIFKQVGAFAPFDWNYIVKNLSSSFLNVKLVPVVGVPLISGLENYALVPIDLSTDPNQVIAMRALKESLRVPDRMGWNGDPCAPTGWDAWEGITCRPNKDRSSLIIYQIDVASQGLKGFISNQISLLSDLESLNLSSNSLGGALPSGLGQKSLVRLDLSNNQFTGPIPDTLSVSHLQLVLLNNNLLEGRVPEELYSVGVHGGAIDVSGNKGLCGIPPLPDCPMFWEKGGLSSGGKIAIGLSCLVVFSVLLLLGYICCIRRRRHDYDFALPHELMSLSAKRNKYQRQKSLMLLEMESQHAKALPSPFSPR